MYYLTRYLQEVIHESIFCGFPGLDLNPGYPVFET